MPDSFEERLERQFPRIEWRRPIRMASPQGTGLGCRFCIARYGIQAHQIPALPQNIADFHSHMKDFHENKNNITRPRSRRQRELPVRSG